MNPASVTRGVARLFAAVLILVAAATVAARAGAPEVDVDVTVTGVFAAMALLCAAAARAQIAPLLARTGGWRGLALAVVAFGILVAFGSAYFPVVRWLGFDTVQFTQPYVDARWPRWACYSALAIAPGVFEELTFRGYLMARLDALLTARETLVVQAALFSVLHLGVVIFPSHFVIGLVLGGLRRRTGSLYPGMAVHLAWNGLLVWAELAGRVFM